MSVFFYNNTGNTVYYYQRSGTNTWSSGSNMGTSQMLSGVDTVGFSTNASLSGITDDTQFDEGVFVPSSYSSISDGDSVGTAGSTNCAGSSCDATLAANSSYNSPGTADTTAPTISSVVITSATGASNNFLNTGDVVSITATFSESVNVTTSGGTPTLAINIGGVSRNSSYSSGSGSNSIVFTYTIASSETTDSDGISIGANAITLNSGTIKDAAGNNATLTHSAVSANSSFKVDTTAPTVSSVAIASATGASNNFLNTGDVVSITATFSEVVNVATSGGAPSLAINIGGVSRVASFISGSGTNTLLFKYTIASSETTDSDGISIGANAITLNGGTIKDLAGNSATITHSAVAANSSYKVDTTKPTVSSITSTTASGTYGVGDSINIQVNFSEAVTLSTGNIVITLETGATDRQVSISSWGSSYNSTVSGTYTVQAGDSTSKLTASGFSLSGGGNLSDAAGNTLTSISLGENLDATKTIIICTKNIESISGPTKKSIHNIDTDYTLNYNEAELYEWPTTGEGVFSSCTDVAPIRVLHVGPATIRNQTGEAGKFYKISEGSTRHH